MKLTIKTETELTATLPDRTRLLETKDGWVTWWRLEKDGIYQISTCRIEDFECQNDTQTIDLRPSEIELLYQIVATPKSRRGNHQ